MAKKDEVIISIIACGMILLYAVFAVYALVKTIFCA